MKSLRTVVLGLAAVTMLASCAKEVTKAEAVKIAEGWDASIVYKTAEAKTVTKYTFGKDCSEAVKAMYEDSEETESKAGKDTAEARISAVAIAALDEKNTVFKADGKALDVTAKMSREQEGLKVAIEEWFKTDENGYVLNQKSVIATTGSALGLVYDVTMTSTTTVTYTK